jgi:cell division protease FtsH
MVTQWGMSDSLGKIALSNPSESFLGEFEGARQYSEETALLIDTEVKRIIDHEYERVLDLIQDHHDKLEQVVKVLLERETLHADEFETLMRGESLPEEEVVVEATAPTPQASPSAPERPSRSPRLPPGMSPKPG